MAGGTPNVKHLWIQDPSGLGNPAVVSESTPEYPGSVGKVGNLKESAGVRTKVLQYVKRVSTDTTVAAQVGAIAYWQDQDDFVVCADQTLAIGGSTAPIAAGVFLGTLPSAGSYGYIQVSGSGPLVLDGAQTEDVVIGDRLFMKAADADGLVTHAVIGTDAATIAAEILVTKNLPVGIALGAQADSSASVTALYQFQRNGW